LFDHLFLLNIQAFAPEFVKSVVVDRTAGYKRYAVTGDTDVSKVFIAQHAQFVAGTTIGTPVLVFFGELFDHLFLLGSGSIRPIFVINFGALNDARYTLFCLETHRCQQDLHR